MKKRGMFLKRKMAAFLALSMVIGSVPTGGLLTAEAAGREKTGRAELIRFDREKLRERAREAAESRKMTAPPRVVASCSDALEFQDDSYELKDADSLLAEGTSLPEDTRLRVFLSPDEAGYEENDGGDLDYTMTGNENLVFMVENESEEMRGYQLVFGNQITDVVTVKSKSQLLREYEAGLEKETATPSDAEEILGTQPAAGAEEAGSQTGEAGAETGAPQETEEEPSSEAESQGEEAKETGASQEEEAAAKDEAGEGIEIETEDTAEEGEQASKVHLLGSLGRFLTGSIEAQAQTLPASPSTALPETETARESQEETAAPKLPDAGAEEAATPSDALAEENPDADGYIRLSSAVISGSVLVYSTQERVDAPQEIKPRMLLHEYGEDEDQAKPKKSNTRAVALVTVPYGDLFAAGGTDNGIRVNLYQYSGKGRDNAAINRYLEGKLQDKEGNSFGFGKGAPAEARINSYYDGEGSVQNIYQGIPEAVGGQDEMNQHLFPAETVGNGAAVLVYPQVNTDDFFTYDPAKNRYSYDSTENGAGYDKASNHLERSDGSGFWPFGADDWYFGMTMEFDFYKPAEGKINESPMVFRFSGDDDVWVYLKKQGSDERHLVLDIGGNHERMDGSINFATGEIIYSNQNAKPSDGELNRARSQDVIANLPKGEACEREWDDDSDYGNTYSVYKTSIDEVCPELGFNRDEAEVYTLEFYYLERGGQQSNCKLDFNLPVVPKQGIKISKQLSGTNLTDEVKTRDYTFQIVSSADADELKQYREGDEGADVTVSEEYTIEGAGSLSIEDAVREDEYFYVQEKEPGTKTVFWDVRSAAGTKPAEGTAAGSNGGCYYSAIYRMPEGEESGFLFTCTNQFGMLDPQIAKRAWRDENKKDGSYDITLEVHGDEMEGTSSEGGNGAVDVVVAADHSQSLWFNGGEEQIRNAIKQLGMSLNGESRLYLLEFASKPGANKRDCPAYDSPNAREYYYDTVFPWLPMDANGKAGLEDKLKGYQVAESNGDTHGAAGFVGAKFALDDLENSPNKKVVIYLTDGKPDCYVKNGILKKGDEGDPEAVEAVKTSFGNLKKAYPDAEVYTIGFLQAAEDGGWLDPDNQDGIQVNKYYSANDYEELLDAIGNISHEITSVEKVKKPIVTDTLSDAVELEEVEVGTSKYRIPDLYVKDGQVSSAADEKGTSLGVSTEDGEVFYYTYEDSPIVIAQYVASTRTITWYPGKTASEAPEEMGEDTVRTLTYRVKAVEPKVETEKHLGDPDTGTHSGEEGYRSNVEATLNYNDGKEKTFPHPVVIPEVVKADLTIQKKVEGYEGQEEYQFRIRFADGEKIETVPQGAVWDSESNSYQFRLEAGETLRFQGIPVGTAYEIEEYNADEIDSEAYVLTRIEAEGTGTKDTATSESRPTGLTAEGEMVENGSQAVFSNVYQPYGLITVRKLVEGNAPANAQFQFSVTDESGSVLEDFRLEANGEKTIRIDPEKINNSFTITETDTQGAWKTVAAYGNRKVEEGTSFTGIKPGDTVTVTNYYYNHAIELTKQVQGQEPCPGQKYPFTVRLKTAGETALVQADVKAVDLDAGKTIEVKDWMEEAAAPSYDYRFTVELAAGQSIRIDNLPQSVTGYEIEENLGQIQVPGYDLQIEKVTVNGKLLGEEAKNTVRVSYDSETPVDQQDQIVFTNQYTAQLGQLQIEKKLTTGAASEDVSFVFKITGEDTKESFYATVTVKQGGFEGTSHILTVPAGAYVIEEVSSSIQYQPVGDSVQKVKVEPDGATAMVTFENQKTGGGYFTDASSVVNQVDEDGFYMETSGEIKPLESALQKAGPFKKPDPVPEAEDGAEQPEV